jgi:hypothetical protein
MICYTFNSCFCNCNYCYLIKTAGNTCTADYNQLVKCYYAIMIVSLWRLCVKVIVNASYQRFIWIL